MKGWPGLDQRPFDPADGDSALPLVHHVISNLKACIVGAYRGITPGYAQSYMDEFCWRYRHRGARAKFSLLLEEAYSHPKNPRSELVEVFSIQVPLAA